MVIGKSTMNLPEYTLYGSDGIKRCPGIWRYAPGGIIETGYYSYETEKLGPYQFREHMGYEVDYFINYVTPPARLLYKALNDTRTAIAAMFVNNFFLCVVYPDSMKYYSTHSDLTKLYMHGDNAPELKHMCNCGWVKTRMIAVDVPRLPYRLQMDLDTTKMYLGDNTWVEMEELPKFSDKIDRELYVSLLENKEARAITVGAFSNNIIYL